MVISLEIFTAQYPLSAAYFLKLRQVDQNDLALTLSRDIQLRNVSDASLIARAQPLAIQRDLAVNHVEERAPPGFQPTPHAVASAPARCSDVNCFCSYEGVSPTRSGNTHIWSSLTGASSEKLNSECATPVPAVIRCTSPARISPAPPVLSLCRSAPSNT